ncbi:hypothetical protein Egran_02459 [Elaphomyces granulatus]|uniref:Very-long-chain (3R)-3-hydroxyacyl-CoA dehydratase n=1 Tax=Elaphomyces granulatus TaxID=519963 RepID=A0A232M058_9EURO|nr:hypothetical protein Egran_02459 [Elaphomyces granulatus]
MASTARSRNASSSSSSSSSGNTIRSYLLAYNSICFALWTTCTLRMVLLIPLLAPSGHSAAVFAHLFSPLLVVTQSLAILEVIHSITGIVRAPVFTTLIQVGSRILLVWGVMYLFREGGRYVTPGEGIVGGDYEGLVGKGVQPGPGAKVGDLAFFGCLAAWGVTECVRYGFFALQVWGMGVPAWWTWLRYNTFYVLYPIGISSECILIWKALKPAAKLHPLYQWFLVAILVIYVPGSYILYTHMIAQRQRVMRGKKRAN